MTEYMRKPMCKRCGRESEPNEIHLFRGGEERRQAIEEGLKTKVTLCTNPPPESFWRDILAEDFEDMYNEIMPIASVKDVNEGIDSWSVIIEIPKPRFFEKTLLPRPGEGLPILGDIYSLEIIQNKQSIMDRIKGTYSDKKGN